jgi:uncharacterized repeat protein (TIGR03803 family)
VLYRFSGKDGAQPEASVIFDAAGNLYGTTAFGGAGCRTGTCGTVFELTPGANGKWTETLLHSFYKDKRPESTVTFDAAGNLYGTTEDGGEYNAGIVFELTPGANGVWSEKILHSFGRGNGGSSPHAGLILDAAGNLYGITIDSVDGRDHRGVVFEITP